MLKKRQVVIGIFFLAFLFLFFQSVGKEEVEENTEGMARKEWLWESIQCGVWNTHTPILSFLNQTKEQTKQGKSFLSLALEQFPINRYLIENMGYEISIEDENTYEMIIRSEGTDENQIDEQGNIIASAGDVGVDETLNEALQKENEAALSQLPKTIDFIPAKEKVREYDLKAFTDFKDLVEEFYVIDKTTMIDAGQLNIENLLKKDMKLQTQNNLPQILIYHTHSQEAFADSVPGDESTTVVGVGEHLADILREKYGYQVIHDTGHYDVESRDYAYTQAAPAIEKILAENPSIEVVIDLHRDGVSGDKKLVTNLNGRPTAQFMFFNGLSRTKARGEISYLPNPHRDDNLSFAFQMQLKCNEYYPGTTRKIYLKGYRYNMHYRPKSLLIELGAQTNTVEEIKNACEPIAHALHMVLSGEEP